MLAEGIHGLEVDVITLSGGLGVVGQSEQSLKNCVTTENILSNQQKLRLAISLKKNLSFDLS